MQFSDLKLGDRLLRPDWEELVATVTAKDADIVTLAIGAKGGNAHYSAPEFDSQPFERAPVPVKAQRKP